MIAEFSIENFLSVKSAQKISFEPSSDAFMSDEYCYEVKEGVKLLKLGLIYGSNASGKTNILNALDFFRRLVLIMPTDRNEKTGIVPFLLDEVSRKEKTRMSMSFYVKQTKYILGFELDSDRIYSETLLVYESVRPTKLYNRYYDAQTDSSVVEFGLNLKMSKKNQDTISGNTINNSSVLAAFGKSNVERTKLNEVYGYFANRIKEVLVPGQVMSSFVKRYLKEDENGSLKKFVLGFLRASDFNIENVALHEIENHNRIGAGTLNAEKVTDTELTFTHKAGNDLYDLPEEYESKGTMRFMSMAVVLNFLLRDDRFVSIDEVETSIHYELLSYFLKVFLANGNRASQMLLTTHDINLLNEDFIRRDTIWFTDKDELGETKISRLSSLGLHKSLSPYNAYKQGKLVRLPFLGSQYFNLKE